MASGTYGYYMLHAASAGTRLLPQQRQAYCLRRARDQTASSGADTLGVSEVERTEEAEEGIYKAKKACSRRKLETHDVS